MKNFKESKVLEVIIIGLFFLIGVGLRFILQIPNFAPVGALALFGGVYFSKKIALIFLLAIMVVSDIFIGYYEPKLMFFVYGSFLLYVILGFWLKKHKKWYTVGGGAILGAVSFFLITNFAVWAFTPWYAKTFSGIVQCYLMALPFFRNTLFGDLFYVAAFFSAYETANSLIKKKISLKEIFSHRNQSSISQKI